MEKKEVLELATKARVERKEAQLDQLQMKPEHYCHRAEVELSRTTLKPLMDSLALEGLQTPVEVYAEAKGQLVVVKGHRRVMAMRLLADDNHPSFKHNMSVQVHVVLDATPEDLTLRSILDNETRKNFSPIERIQVVAKLHKAGVPVQRAAAALGVGTKTFERDRLVAEQPWMLRLILEACIVPTTAVALLEIAKSTSRFAELEADLNQWCAETKKKIEERRTRRQKLKDGSDLRPAERLVKHYMTKELVQRWITQLRNGERFDGQVVWDFAGGFDPETNELVLEGIRLNVANAPLDRLVRVGAKLGRIYQDVVTSLKKRRLIEKSIGAQDAVEDEADDTLAADFLRREGLEDLVDELETEQDAERGDNGKGTEHHGTQDNSSS